MTTSIDIDVFSAEDFRSINSRRRLDRRYSASPRHRRPPRRLQIRVSHLRTEHSEENARSPPRIQQLLNPPTTRHCRHASFHISCRLILAGRSNIRPSAARQQSADSALPEHSAGAHRSGITAPASPWRAVIWKEYYSPSPIATSPNKPLP